MRLREVELMVTIIFVGGLPGTVCVCVCVCVCGVCVVRVTKD